jgi:hypothetical protein
MRYTFIATQTRTFIDPDFEYPGLGGFEASLVLLTRQLSLRGHVVEIYSNSDVEGVFHGVRYRNLSRFNKNEQCETLILFRSAWPGLADAKAKAKVFWSIDTDWADWDETVFPYINQVLCISPFHRDFIQDHCKKVVPESLRLLELGVVGSDYFEEAPDAIPPKPGNRMIYCSLPDRGLINLVRLFPRVRTVVPEAQLVITSDFSLCACPPT